MRVVFLNVPAHGHTNPTLPVVAELVRRGHEVDYWSFEEFRGAIEATGARYRAYPDLGDYAETQVTRSLLHLAHVLLEVTGRALPALLEAYEHAAPDLVVRDSLAVWGTYLATMLRVPLASSIPTFIVDTRVLLREPALARYIFGQVTRDIHDLVAFARLGRALERRYGVAPPRAARGLIAYERLNIVFTSRAFQPLGDTFGPRYVFVGASLREERETLDLATDDRPLVYVSLGTLFNDRPDFYRACLEAVAGRPWQVVMAVGSNVDAGVLGRPPSNVVLRRWVPQLALLRRASAFLTHGGMNGTTEALVHGVPLVVYPQAHDQLVVAERVEEVGAGLVLRGRPDAARIGRALEAVLVQPRYRQAAARIGATLREAGGARRAVDELERYARGAAAAGSRAGLATATTRERRTE